MATTINIKNTETLSCGSTAASGTMRWVNPYYVVTWSNFVTDGTVVSTITLPKILRNKSTIITKAVLHDSSNANSGKFTETTDYTTDNNKLLAKIQDCQARGLASFDIGMRWVRTSAYSQNFTSSSAATDARDSSKTLYGTYTIQSIDVTYIDYEYTIDGIGQFDVSPSTDKILGGKSDLTTTIRITPSLSIAAGALDFYVYPEDESSHGVSFTNSTALQANQEVTYTVTNPYPIVDAENPNYVYDAKVSVRLNGVEKTNINWASKLHIKSGCDPLIINSPFHTWYDSNGYYEHYQSYIENASASGVNINVTNENCSYDTFLTNSITPTMRVYFSNYDQTYTLTNGANSFPCPPNSANSQLDGGRRTMYQCTFTLTDGYGQTASYTDSIHILKYTVPNASGLDIQRYMWEDLSQQEIIDDEGMYGKLWGQISFTKFPQRGTPPNRTPTNPVSLTVVVTSTDDTTFASRIGALPYTAYSTDFSGLTPEPDTYYTYILDGIHLNPDHVTENEPFQSNHTYNFEITFSDGINTIIRYTEFSSASSYFLVEKEGVAVGGATSGTIGNERFDVHYPMNVSSIDQFYGQPYDTGWVSLNSYIISSNFTQWSDDDEHRLEIRRIGRIVYLKGVLRTQIDIPFNRGYGVFNNLPEIFHPAYPYDIPLAADYYCLWLRVGMNCSQNNNKTSYSTDDDAMCIRNRIDDGYTFLKGTDGHAICLSGCYIAKY